MLIKNALIEGEGLPLIVNNSKKGPYVMIELSFDGKTATAVSGDNLLTCAINAGVAIPHLCHHTHQSDTNKSTNSLQNKQSCGLCYVELTDASGCKSTVKACETSVTEAITVITHSVALSKIRQASLKNLLSDHFADCEAPCQQACPAGVDVQSYLYHIAQGNHREAVKIIKQTVKDQVHIIPAGEIQDYDTALKYLQIGADRIRASKKIKISKTQLTADTYSKLP